MKKHINQVIVGNVYNSEEYYHPIPGVKGLVRYFTTGEKVSLALHMIDKGMSEEKEHTHVNEQALICPQGDGEVLIDGQVFQAEPGFFAIIPPNLPHTYSAKKATYTSWNYDIFVPARLEYEKDTYFELLAEHKDPSETSITE